MRGSEACEGFAHGSASPFPRAPSPSPRAFHTFPERLRVHEHPERHLHHPCILHLHQSRDLHRHLHHPPRAPLHHRDYFTFTSVPHLSKPHFCKPFPPWSFDGPPEFEPCQHWRESRSSSCALRGPRTASALSQQPRAPRPAPSPRRECARLLRGGTRSGGLARCTAPQRSPLLGSRCSLP